jgi:hypothetical protein
MSEMQELAQVSVEFYVGESLVLLRPLSVREIARHADVLGALAAIQVDGVVPDESRFGMLIAMGNGLFGLVAAQTGLPVEKIEVLTDDKFWELVNKVLAVNRSFFSLARLSVEKGRAMAAASSGIPLSSS